MSILSLSLRRDRATGTNSRPPALPSLPRPYQPRCDHFVVRRVYDVPCLICKRVPFLGWVYECGQDEYLVETLAESIDSSRYDFAAEPLRCSLRLIGLNETIIETAMRGGYTDDQMRRIISNRRSVNQLVQARALRFGPTLGSRPCHVRACHHCYPLLRERHYLSLNAVLADSHTSSRLGSSPTPPVHSARVVGSLGLRRRSATALSDGDTTVPPITTCESAVAEENGPMQTAEARSGSFFTGKLNGLRNLRSSSSCPQVHSSGGSKWSKWCSLRRFKSAPIGPASASKAQKSGSPRKSRDSAMFRFMFPPRCSQCGGLKAPDSVRRAEEPLDSCSGGCNSHARSESGRVVAERTAATRRTSRTSSRRASV